MTVAARRLKRRTSARIALSEGLLNRLMNFPAVRAAISEGIGRRRPLKVDIPRSGQYVHFRLEDPRKFVPELFATIAIGKKGTKAVIGTPKAAVKSRAALRDFLRRHARAMRSADRRSLVYQLRKAGIIGGSRAQSILVPKARVEQVVAKFVKKPAFQRVAARANPVLATLGFSANPCRSNLVIEQSIRRTGSPRHPRAVVVKASHDEQYVDLYGFPKKGGPEKSFGKMRRVYASGGTGAGTNPRENAAAGAEKVVRAFLQGRKARAGSRPEYMAGARYETDGQALIQWGSVIARKVPGGIAITDAGYRTKTTMAMLNAVLKSYDAGRIFQKKNQWFLETRGGVRPWLGKAIVKFGAPVTVVGNPRRRVPKTRSVAYTLVRHTGYTVGRDPKFSRAVETRNVETTAQAFGIKRAGGLLFSSYGHARKEEEAVNQPPEVKGLALPYAFGKARDFDEEVYIPPPFRSNPRSPGCPRGKVRSRRGRCVQPIGYRAKKGKLYGWKTDLPAAARHAALMRSIRADGWTTTIRRLYYLVNISHDQKTRAVARQDAAWMDRNRASLERVRRVAANDPVSAILAGLASAAGSHILRGGRKNARRNFKANPINEWEADEIIRWIRKHVTWQRKSAPKRMKAELFATGRLLTTHPSSHRVYKIGQRLMDRAAAMNPEVVHVPPTGGPRRHQMPGLVTAWPTKRGGKIEVTSDRRRYKARGVSARDLNGGAKRNAPVGTVAINIPFRDGQKVKPNAVRRWLQSLPNSPLKTMFTQRFEQNMRQYRKFHLGSEPKTFIYKNVPMGASKRVTDVDFVTSEGKEWAASYQVPKHSKKYAQDVDGRYLHSHGESGIEVEIKKPAGRKQLPERFHTADGKFVGVVPSRNVTITDWYRG